jgi:protein gp37
MSDNSKIEWTDASWNPVTGCTKVSPGCDHCYAETFAERWRGTPGHHFENGFDVTLRRDRLLQPKQWKRPRRIFVNSTSDVFHEAVPDDYILQMFAVMAVSEQHQFQVLTKRHGRMRSLLNRPKFADDVWALVWQLDGGLAWRKRYWPLRNVWLGVSVEDQHWADIRIPALLDTPAAVRFLSCEPLLGRVHLGMCDWVPPGVGDYPGVHNPLTGEWWPCEAGDYAREYEGRITELPRIDWVIVGGESGPKARPMHPDWARSIRDECRFAEVPFFFKQWGEWRPLAGNECAFAGDEFYPGRFDGPMARRVGKKAAGHELDGQVWQQYPASAEAVLA